MAKKYNIAMYIRISVDDDIGNDESFSITNQRLFLSEFIKKKTDIQDYCITEYCDDGYTGTNFKRPFFRKMLQDINCGMIDCIIVKDFSRFARNYIDITDFLCCFFPTNNIRFISVNDNFDGKYDDPTEIDVSFKNLMYDFYSKDISQKVRSGVYQLMKKGNFIGSKPPYGYKIDNTGATRRLIVDEESSKIVKRIFDMLIDGSTTVEISTIFNNEKIMTPSQFRIYRGYQKKDKTIKPFWDNHAIRGVVRNEQYTGKLINAKTMTKEIGSSNSKQLPKENHIITENAHEPIVSVEIFEQAQKCIKANYKKFHKTSGNRQSKNRKKITQLFIRKIKCAYCGRVMNFYHSPDNPKYVCRSANVGFSAECSSVIVLEKDIENAILANLEKYINLVINKNKVRNAVHEKQKLKGKYIKDKITKLKKSLNSFKKMQIINYENFIDEKISKQIWEKKQAEIENDINNISTQLDDIDTCQETVIPSFESSSPLVNHIISNNELISLNRELVDELVQEVIVYSSDCFEIVWKFKDIFSR